ncbi:hypothetical protein GCM10007967_13690 [Xylanimonas ulmi]
MEVDHSTARIEAASLAYERQRSRRSVATKTCCTPRSLRRRRNAFVVVDRKPFRGRRTAPSSCPNVAARTEIGRSREAWSAIQTDSRTTTARPIPTDSNEKPMPVRYSSAAPSAASSGTIITTRRRRRAM